MASKKRKSDIFEAERIIDETFNKRKRRIEYRVRWRNCTPEQDTYEPAENILSSVLWNEYLARKQQAQKMKELEEENECLKQHVEELKQQLQQEQKENVELRASIVRSSSPVPARKKQKLVQTTYVYESGLKEHIYHDTDEPALAIFTIPK